MMRSLLILGCLLPGVALWSQTAALIEHLQTSAAKFSYRLVYSAKNVPDTSFQLGDYSRLSPKQQLDTLTRPFGLTYALLGDQLVVTRRRPTRFSVSGYVEDYETGERLVGATVTLEGSQRGTITNGYGYFSLTALQSGDRLLFSYVGYPGRALDVVRGASRNVVVKLRPSYELSVVEVSAGKQAAAILPNAELPLPAQALDDAEFRFGERNINTWLLQMAGVQSSPAGYGGYAFRGADPNQNLVLVDDATLYLPSHAAGLTSAVPGEAIRSIKVHKNGGHARYGDRVGGVVDLRLKEGNRDRRSSTISVGIADVRAATEGPLGKGSYFATARRGLTDFWLDVVRPSVRPEDSNIPNLDFVYSDFTGKINYPLGDRHRIYASVYFGKDDYEDFDEVFTTENNSVDAFLDQSTREWQNALATLRHSFTVGSRWFFATTATRSEFSYDANDYFLLREALGTPVERFTFARSQFATNVLDLGLKHDAEFAFNSKASLEFGLDVVAHRFRVGTQTSSGNQLTSPDSLGDSQSYVATGDLPQLQTYDASLYANMDWQLGSRWSGKLGARLSSQLGEGQMLVALLPRINASYQLDPRHKLSVDIGESRQYLHSVSTLNPGLPRDIWVPSVGGLRAQESRYATIGLTGNPAARWSYVASAYVQRFSGLARFSSNFASLALDQWVDQLRQGEGLSYGIETEAEWRSAHWQVNAAYTYAKATRTYADAFGELIQDERFKLDRRHTLVTGVRRTVGDLWSLGLSFTYGSGLPARLPVPNALSQDLPSTNVPLTNSWNYSGPQFELRNYQSLDLGVRRVQVVERRTYRLVFGVQNLYLRKNPLFANLQRRNDAAPGEANYRFTQVSMLPLLPFLRYSITF